MCKHMNAVNGSSDRIAWIDFAKGIAIILVIIGHTVDGLFRGMIFSFHMPLFFILSCVTFKYSENDDQFRKTTKKGFKHLIIPAITMFFIDIIINVVKDPSTVANSELLKCKIINDLLSLLFASGVDTYFIDTRIPAIGIIWFLFVLFEGRTLFDYLNLKLTSRKLILYSLFLSIAGVIFGRMFSFPLSFDIALAIFPLLLIGKNYGVLNVENNAGIKLLLSFASWLLCFLIPFSVSSSYMELTYRRYTFYPFCYVIAFLGTLMISELGVICCRAPFIAKPIVYLGKNSLYMLCIHILDYPLWPWTFNWSQHPILNAITRVIADLVVFTILMLTKSIYEGIKKQKQQV